MSDLFKAQYNPDVLSCIANLSNDEVFTPPEVANQMLDLLPKEIWSDPDITFFDPACKSGVFLRECAKRLIEGQLPGYQVRVDEINEKKADGGDLGEADESYLLQLEAVLENIFKKQLYGMAITELTSLLSRRSVYCSKFPNSDWSVVKFDNAEGNIDYKRLEHSWAYGKCTKCGVPKNVYDRNPELESYAYEFIHLDSVDEVFDMKFDVVISNPPYQMNDGGGNGSSAMPIYHRFIEQAKRLNPKYMTMIIPAKWQSGGKGLDQFRDEMLHDRRISKMVTYADSRDCFQGVDVAGGICYFLWERDKQSDCESTFNELGNSYVSQRNLGEYPIFIPSDIAVDVVRKVKSASDSFYDDIVRSRKPFGVGSGSDVKSGSYGLRWRGGMSKIAPSEVSAGLEMVDKWKVVISKAAAEHAGQSDKSGKRKMLTVIEVLPPKTVCSETYLVVDAFDDEQSARNLEAYIKTKFVRYLIWQATPTQNISKSCFMFVPVVNLDKTPSDAQLYKQFDLSDEEVSEIEAKMKDFPVKGDEDA